MSDEDTREPVWHLGSMPRARPTGGQWVFNLGDQVSEEEHQSHQASVQFLMTTFSQSPFSALQDRCNEFRTQISEVARAFETRPASAGSMIQSVRSQLDELLTALRRFADRTAHSLSQRYGKNSPELATFKDALSREFDSEFAYRFTWHLRNYSDHRSGVPLQVRQVSRLGPHGSTERQSRLFVDSRKLLEGYAWHSLVRPDLERINGEFPIDVVVDGLQICCSRVFCKTLLAQESQIRAAIENIRSFAGRAEVDDGEEPVFIRPISHEAGQIQISPIYLELADMADAALQQARVLVG